MPVPTTTWASRSRPSSCWRSSAMHSDQAVAAEPFLSRASGLPLRHFRPEHVAEQIARACARDEAADAGELARRLTRDRAARTRFRRSVAISHGAFFRDPEQFRL